MIYFKKDQAISFRHSTRQYKNKARRVTVCQLVEKTGEKTFRVISEGVAECSLRDNYNKELGRKIALGRALKGSGLNQSEVLEAYASR